MNLLLSYFCLLFGKIALLYIDEYPLTVLHRSQILQGTPTSILCSQIILCTIEEAPKLFYALDCVPSVLRKIVESIGETAPSISRPAREAKELTKSVPPFCDDDAVHSTFGS